MLKLARSPSSLLPLSLLAALSACSDSAADGDQDEADETGETGDTGEELVEPFDEFPGLSAAVEIRIDERGIPHIYGEHDDDVAYASGYQMASDRLFQMDLMRRRALGRQAEVLGPDFVDQDVVSRTFDLKRWGNLNAERLRSEAPDIYNYVISWLAGVNQRIAEVQSGAASLPYGFAEAGFMPETWERDDEFAIAKLLYLGNSNSFDRDLLATILHDNLQDTWAAFELGKPLFDVAIMPDDEIPTGLKPDSGPSSLELARPPRPMDPYSPALIAEAVAKLQHATAHLGKRPFGSNNWAVDGRFTADGRPLIANDPHQPLQSPSMMYAQHLDSASAGKGGTQEVIGFSFAGTMGVQLGHNRHVQWAATTNFGDVTDVWDVRVEGEGVWIGDQFVDWVEREEVIEVAGEESVVLSLHDVPDYGVIVPEQLIPLPVASPGRELLVNWTGFRATAEELCFARMGQASDLDEWEAGVDLMEVAGFNFVGASAEGISYRVNILVPDRDLSGGALPYLVIDGDDAASYWRSYLPAEKLPRSRVESRGWIGTANNDPWGFTFDGDVTNDPFYYGYFYAAGHRAKRLQDELERLTGEGEVSVADMQALQLDTHSVMADLLLPIVLDAADQIGTNPDLADYEGNADLQTLAAVLDGWDRNMDRSSAGALVWHLWLHDMAWETISDDFAFLYTLVFAEEPPYILKIPALALTHGYSTDELLQTSRERIAVEALASAATWLNERYGSVDPEGYSWADMHGTDFQNPFGMELDGGWVPTNGGEDTLNVSSSVFYASSQGEPNERFDSHHGPIFRLVTRFAEDGVPEAVINFPRGNSGEPSSPHWDDTLDDWIEGVYSPLPYRIEDVEAATVSQYRLEP
ncbi:penicillin acylase family protein [Pseudenhygromyxa sp. WMMC2535]|uniref:penicillin acylase family protein n=1 Tax=Pseudenhygromyxa sp. WMMC2535 TaxID=2712867 RepID=UPI0015565DDD|nr:penicillin acylase family protein [Pseudenhygromyxa sp. WMMC2535]NVB39225.1 penicillin acylase family protein [Pseudenhygromyxa sp. WMMC2535]